MAKRRRKSRSRRRSGSSSGGGIMGAIKRVPRTAFSITGLILMALGAIGIFVVGGKAQSKAQAIASKVNPNAPKTA